MKSAIKYFIIVLIVFSMTIVARTKAENYSQKSRDKNFVYDAPTINFNNSIYYCYEGIAGTVEFSVSTYRPTQPPKVYGFVYNQDGSEVAEIKCVPLFLYDSTKYKEPDMGQNCEYLGIIDRVLNEGKYTIKLIYDWEQGVTEDDAKYKIYKTEIDEARRLERYLEYGLYYGNYLSFRTRSTINELSDENDYRIKLNFHSYGKDPDINYIHGLSITEDDSILINNYSNRLSLQIIWVQPITGKELILFEEECTIHQEGVQISWSGKPKVIYDEEKLEIIIDSINVTYSKTVGGGEGKLYISASFDKKSNASERYTNPQLSSHGNYYTITLFMKPYYLDNLKKQDNRIRIELADIIYIRLKAKIYNRFNNVGSEETEKLLKIPVCFFSD